LNWLPDHFGSHNCDLSKLENLVINVQSNFNDLTSPNRMDYCKQVEILTKIYWKADGRAEETIEIKEIELVKKEYFKIGVPEF
jgi:hypothetical protein